MALATRYTKLSLAFQACRCANYSAANFSAPDSGEVRKCGARWFSATSAANASNETSVKAASAVLNCAVAAEPATNASGTIHVSRYACKKVITQIILTMPKLCRTARRNSSPSLPTSLVEAVATAMLCGEIIFAATPPEELEATVKTGSSSSDSAVRCCTPLKSAFDYVSLPVRKNAQPTEKWRQKRKYVPCLLNAAARVAEIPE